MDRFNATGRDCPRCFRKGTLSGTPVAGVTLECSGCAAVFKVEDGGRTLARQRLEPYRAEDKVCGICGVKHWNYGSNCAGCSVARAW